MSKMVRQLAAAGVLAALSLSAAASVVRYEFTSAFAPVAPNSGSNFAGYVEFDSSLLVANTTIAVGSFTDWAFTWGNDFSWGMGTHLFDANFDSFGLDATLQATGVNLCFSASGICNTSEHPVALVTTFAAAATHDASGVQSSAPGSWSGPLQVGAVPEPATLALVGLALLAGAGARLRPARAAGH